MLIIFHDIQYFLLFVDQIDGVKLNACYGDRHHGSMLLHETSINIPLFVLPFLSSPVLSPPCIDDLSAYQLYDQQVAAAFDLVYAQRANKPNVRSRMQSIIASCASDWTVARGRLYVSVTYTHRGCVSRETIDSSIDIS